MLPVDLLPPCLFIYPPAAVVIVLPGKRSGLVDVRCVQLRNTRLPVCDCRSPADIRHVRLHSQKRFDKFKLPLLERFMLPGIDINLVSCFAVLMLCPCAQSNNIPAFSSG